MIETSTRTAAELAEYEVSTGYVFNLTPPTFTLAAYARYAVLAVLTEFCADADGTQGVAPADWAEFVGPLTWEELHDSLDANEYTAEADAHFAQPGWEEETSDGRVEVASAAIARWNAADDLYGITAAWIYDDCEADEDGRTFVTEATVLAHLDSAVALMFPTTTTTEVI